MIKLLAVGDICLQTKNDKDPFSGVHGILQDKDILFGNLETALSDCGRIVERAVPLHIAPEYISFLKNAGFDIMNIANNHVMDRGLSGFNLTLKALVTENIHFVGSDNSEYNSKSLVIEKNDLKIGFIAYNSINFPTHEGEKNPVHNLLKTDIKADIDTIKDRCDVLIVSLHWGTENVFYPSPSQIDTARWIIDNGVHLVLGHHPSVLQGIEKYKSGLIVYSLGNFQFIDDAPKSIVEYTKETAVFVFELDQTGVKDYQLIPCKIDQNYCPQPLYGEDANRILSFVREVSVPVEKNLINDKRWFEEIAWNHLATNLDAWRIRIKIYGFTQIPMLLRWLVLRFNLKCYFGLLRKYFSSVTRRSGIKDVRGF